MKLYIAVLDVVPDYMAPTLVAHAVLGAHLEFAGKHELYDQWLTNSFKKVTLKVNAKEFERIRALPSAYHAYERTVANGETTCVVVAPSEEIPNVLKFARLWKPTSES